MIDLIDESGEDLCHSGYTTHKLRKYSTQVSTMSVKKNSGSFDKGEYVIISSPLMHELDYECHDYISNILKKYFIKLKGNARRKVLVVGLGNPQILADSLGNKVVESVNNSPLKDNHIFKFCPNIFTSTGIDSFEVVHLLTKWLDVGLVVVIDSLATKNIDRLGVSLQINSAGMTPGSAINNLGKKINSQTLGVKCISIGVPLMLMIEDRLLTPKDIHCNLDTLAYIISKALNETL